MKFAVLKLAITALAAGQASASFFEHQHELSKQVQNLPHDPHGGSRIVHTENGPEFQTFNAEQNTIGTVKLTEDQRSDLVAQAEKMWEEGAGKYSKPHDDSALVERGCPIGVPCEEPGDCFFWGCEECVNPAEWSIGVCFGYW